MEELRLSFIIGGAVAIVGVLCHGLWSVRKRNQAQKEHARDEALSDNYDDVSATMSDDDPLLHDDDVELVMLSSDEYEKSTIEPSFSVDSAVESSDVDEPVVSSNVSATAKKVSEEAPTVATDVSAEQTPITATNKSTATELPRRFESNVSHVDAQSAYPEPPDSLLKVNDEPEISQEPDVPRAPERSEERVSRSVKPSDSVNQPIDKMVQKTKARKPSTKGRVEPSLGQDQIRIDFEPDAPVDEVVEASSQSEPEEDIVQPEQEVLVLNVRMDEGEGMSGAALLPMLLTLGFKFGDQDIFHRHVNSNGKGPVLFSLANMFKPGVFDIDNLENFTTQGVSLFMILPIEGDAHQVFNMMHNAARKIADEFGGKVLDGRRSALNKQSLQQYVEKIREFERKRMIRR